jgi:heme-degrading monooxygenase HmoA
MISRHWGGLAEARHADAYVQHLRSETFVALSQIPGFVKASLLRRDVDRGVEFLVITTWESVAAIAQFAGPDPEVAVVPEQVQRWMVDYDRRARHYDVIG